ncbi:hypothetical protein os4_37150 (plasmid) [Comamonadaceae bacterium OS-4]|nr:hypothetical protein os4_37150 [Comamonadaceae bacterium OS-4]
MRQTAYSRLGCPKTDPTMIYEATSLTGGFFLPKNAHDCAGGPDAQFAGKVPKPLRGVGLYGFAGKLSTSTVNSQSRIFFAFSVLHGQLIQTSTPRDLIPSG